MQGMLNCLVKGFVQFGFFHVLDIIVQTIFRQRGLCSCCNYCMYAWALAERIANTSVGSSRIPKLIVLQALLLSPWLGHVNHCLEVTYISLFHVPCLKKKKKVPKQKKACRHTPRMMPPWGSIAQYLSRMAFFPEWISVSRNTPVLKTGMSGQQDVWRPFSRAAVGDTTNVSSLPWLQTALLTQALTPERARNHLRTFPKFWNAIIRFRCWNMCWCWRAYIMPADVC